MVNGLNLTMSDGRIHKSWPKRKQTGSMNSSKFSHWKLKKKKNTENLCIGISDPQYKILMPFPPVVFKYLYKLLKGFNEACIFTCFSKELVW